MCPAAPKPPCWPPSRAWSEHRLRAPAVTVAAPLPACRPGRTQRRPRFRMGGRPLSAQGRRRTRPHPPADRVRRPCCGWACWVRRWWRCGCGCWPPRTPPAAAPAGRRRAAGLTLVPGSGAAALPASLARPLQALVLARWHAAWPPARRCCPRLAALDGRRRMRGSDLLALRTLAGPGAAAAAGAGSSSAAAWQLAVVPQPAWPGRPGCVCAWAVCALALAPVPGCGGGAAGPARAGPPRLYMGLASGAVPEPAADRRRYALPGLGVPAVAGAAPGPGLAPVRWTCVTAAGLVHVLAALPAPAGASAWSRLPGRLLAWALALARHWLVAAGRPAGRPVVVGPGPAGCWATGWRRRWCCCRRQRPAAPARWPACCSAWCWPATGHPAAV